MRHGGYGSFSGDSPGFDDYQRHQNSPSPGDEYEKPSSTRALGCGAFLFVGGVTALTLLMLGVFHETKVTPPNCPGLANMTNGSSSYLYCKEPVSKFYFPTHVQALSNYRNNTDGFLGAKIERGGGGRGRGLAAGAVSVTVGERAASRTTKAAGVEEERVLMLRGDDDGGGDSGPTFYDECKPGSKGCHQLIGLGMNYMTIEIFNVAAFAVGLYVDPQPARNTLQRWNEGTAKAVIAPTPELSDALSVGNFAITLRMEMYLGGLDLLPGDCYPQSDFTTLFRTNLWSFVANGTDSVDTDVLLDAFQKWFDLAAPENVCKNDIITFTMNAAQVDLDSSQALNFAYLHPGDTEPVRGNSVDGVHYRHASSLGRGLLSMFLDQQKGGITNLLEYLWIWEP